MIADYLLTPVTFILVLIFLFNLSQRKHLEYGEKKRMASLFFAFGILIIYGGVLVITRKNLSDIFLIIPVIFSVTFLILFRQKIFIFSGKCTRCAGKVSLANRFYHDEPLCESCRNIKPMTVPDNVEDIDWDTWQAKEEATICFIKKDDEVLLIHKKRGLGHGKINGPGGRLDPGEKPLQTAIRETQEEVGLTPVNPELRGELNFQFKDGYSLKGYVYYTEEFEGTPIETDEAKPFWCNENEIPYEKMWEDDQYWFPSMLKNEFFKGYFIFNKNDMVSHKIIK